MKLNQITGTEFHKLAEIVCSFLASYICSFNMMSNLFMKFLHLLSPLLNFVTNLRISWDRQEISQGERANIIHKLKWRMLGSIRWSPIIGKLNMGKL